MSTNTLIRLAAALVLGFVLGALLIHLPFFGIYFVPMSPITRVLAGVALIWWVLPKMFPKLGQASATKPAGGGSSPRKPAPLEITTENSGSDEWSVIRAQPSPMPKRGPLLVILAPSFLCVFLILNVNGAWQAAIAIWVIFAGLGLAWLSHADRNKRMGKLGPFAVKHDAIRLPDGQEIARSRLYRFAIRNTESGGITFYGGNTVQQAIAAGAASTHQRMLRISNAVVAEHDGTFSYLAGGLTEELANAVLHEIVRRVDGFAIQ